MVVERLHNLTLRIEPSEGDPSRYEWSVLRHGRIVRRAPWSAPDRALALKQGHIALQEAYALWHDSHQRRIDRVPDSATGAVVVLEPRGSGRTRSDA